VDVRFEDTSFWGDGMALVPSGVAEDTAGVISAITSDNIAFSHRAL